MATRKRNVRNINRKTKTKSKYFMKGCAIKNKSLASKIKHRKTCPKCRRMRGGCGTCNMGGGNIRGGGSLGFLDNIFNISGNALSSGRDFVTSIVHAAPQSVSAYPTDGQLPSKYN
jgi:hypothetical protein